MLVHISTIATFDDLRKINLFVDVEIMSEHKSYVLYKTVF